MDIYERINGNAYKALTPYPVKPHEPRELKVPAGKLTGEDFAALPGLKRDYNLAIAEYRAKLDAYRDEENQLIAQFWVDLHAYHEVKADDPFVQMMDGIAYEDGHSGGLSSVAHEFESLMPLYELYAKRSK